LEVGRELQVAKSNYGPVGEKLRLRWEEGSFVVATAAKGPELAAEEANLDRLFLRLLEKHSTQGRRVYPRRGHGFAPKEFERDSEAKVAGITARAFAASMDRLFSAGAIVTKTKGPPSRQVTYIDRAGGKSD
jgi:hypothetical protein